MTKRFWQLKRVRLGSILALLILLAPYIYSRLCSPHSKVAVHSIDEINIGRDKKSVRIVTYNIAHARGLAESNWQPSADAVTEQLDRIADLLLKLDGDIVLLNEVDFDCSWSSHVNQAEHLARKAGYRFRVEQRNLDFRVLGWTWRFGNAILSRYPISNAEPIDLPAFARWEDFLVGSKDGVTCTISVGETSFRTINAHLSPRSEATRVDSVKAISALKKRSELPLVIGGDFNSAPKGYPAWDQTAELKNAIDELDKLPGLQRIPAKNLAQHFTFPADAPARTIDWIFAPADWTVLQIQVPKTLLSDHCPVVGEFQW